MARGTPFYACPEQMSGSAPGWDAPQADLYGVGATFFWLLTDEAPLQYEAGAERDPWGFRNLIRAGIRPQLVHDLVPGIPNALGLLIDRWLSFDPAGRVPPGTVPRDAIRVARAELAALQPGLPDLVVGTGPRPRAWRTGVNELRSAAWS